MSHDTRTSFYLNSLIVTLSIHPVCSSLVCFILLLFYPYLHLFFCQPVNLVYSTGRQKIERTSNDMILVGVPLLEMLPLPLLLSLLLLLSA